ncbi:MAG: hypothetical protein CVV04_11940 [Firmicutes bacterium HGW-Firmicutes-9]|jgi:hypothetical protein|nr:MAG: hypothetical protein CVV04_11940 [Firmicutes bacterium HGW-Firmicutes-9]
MKESMKALCADIEAAGEKELARAAAMFGETNNSPHESYAVILEEFQEAQTDGRMFEHNIDFYWDAVKKNDEKNQDVWLKEMKEKALRAAIEWTQVYAMCAKALKKKENN